MGWCTFITIGVTGWERLTRRGTQQGSYRQRGGDERALPSGALPSLLPT
jgi:hypothetical protein